MVRDTGGTLSAGKSPKIKQPTHHPANHKQNQDPWNHHERTDEGAFGLVFGFRRLLAGKHFGEFVFVHDPNLTPFLVSLHIGGDPLRGHEHPPYMHRN